MSSICLKQVFLINFWCELLLFRLCGALKAAEEDDDRIIYLNNIDSISGAAPTFARVC